MFVNGARRHPTAGVKPMAWLFAVMCSISFVVAAHGEWEDLDHTTVYETVWAPQWTDACSDGHGGMLVVTFDGGATLNKIYVSRIGQTGSELWSDGGIALPFRTGTDGQAGPLAVAGDGLGGAYVAYRELWPGNQHYLALAHISADGTFDWSLPVGDFIADDDDLAVAAIPTNSTDVILVWTQNHGFPNDLLKAARFYDSGASIWEVTVADNVHLSPDPPNAWCAATDGLDGVLIGLNREPFSMPFEHRIQRVHSSGTVLWGANGTQLWQNMGNIVEVLADGSGGGLALNRVGYGENWVNHVNSAGTADWAAGGVKVFDLGLTLRLDTTTFCSDNAGGCIVTSGMEELWVQRVGSGGGLLWAAGAVNGFRIDPHPGWQDDQVMCSDGAGGAYIVYPDHYYSEPSYMTNQQIVGTRLDGWGNILWSDYVLIWGWQDGFEPFNLQLVPDGNGGALVAWDELGYDSSDDYVLALGVGPDGSVPAKPNLTYLLPDAGTPDTQFAGELLGTYLDMSQTFHLQQPGGGTLPVIPLVAHSPQVMEVSLDLTGAASGAWDLVLSQYGTPQDTLQYAFGVGEPPPCEDEGTMGASGSYASSSGSLRKVAFDSFGNAHAFYLLDLGSHYRIYRHTVTADAEWTDPVFDASPGEYLADLSIAIGPDDRQHLVFVDAALPSRLLYLRFDSDGALEHEMAWTAGNEIYAPAVAVNGQGAVHVVFEEYDVGTATIGLKELMITESSFDGPHDLGAGTNAREPDLMPYGEDGFILTFVRDFWFPGLREVCYQFYEGGWATPVGIYFGLYVNSPTVAWDGDDTALLAFVLDNVGTAPLIHTCRIDGGVAEPVRWRVGAPNIYRTVVAAAGDESFWLLTQESESGIPMHINLRAGDGHVFYPVRRLNNAVGDVDAPFLGAAMGGGGVYAMWSDFSSGLYTHGFYACVSTPPSPVPEADTGLLALRAHPNPFNPQTVLEFGLAQPGPTKLAVFDLRGRKVRTLLNEELASGDHEIIFDGRDDEGRRLASGVFFARLELPHRLGEMVTKLVLVK